MTADHLGFVLLAGAGVVIAAVVAARLAHAAGLPALLVFLGLGLALGESGLGVRFDDAGLAELLGLGALVLILAEGGLTTSWARARMRRRPRCCWPPSGWWSAYWSWRR